MKARPILFQSDMVRAILNGRKTQTRRVVKLDQGGKVRPPNMPIQWSIDPSDPSATKACPYGQPGDLLWVRETFATWLAGEIFGGGFREMLAYRAGRMIHRVLGGIWSEPILADDKKPDCVPWSPSIHMPRRASRLTLRVTGVRLERLHEITVPDIRAEGVELTGKYRYLEPTDWEDLEFIDLWNSIHGAGAWDANPWVWVIEFEPIHANVDDFLQGEAV